jgi:hypothetical protein
MKPVRGRAAALLASALLLGAAAPVARADSAADEQAVPAGEAKPKPAATPTPDPTPAPESKTRIDLYGAAMLDMGYETKQSDPNWFDVARPTKLPSFAKQFGEDGRWFAGVRQSRLGVKSFTPTSLGELKTIFEFELFGTGVDAGQTTFRLRHAWGELGQIGAGQTWSPYMDPDVFPNSIEYWGPNGMVFFRNVQLRWMPMQGDNELWIALERPGASADQGTYADRIALQNVKPHFPAPDFSMHYKRGGDWGHVQIAAIYRYMSWKDTVPGEVDLSGHANGWGFNLSTNIKTPMNGTVRASVVYGEGVENYMNDAPVDIGVKTNLIDPRRPFLGKALPVLGIVAFYDFNWSDRFSSAIGYSQVHITNSNGQASDAFKTGQYALTNLLYYPVKNVMAGLEFQWGHRENFSDGFKVPDYRLQFSARYNFNIHIGGDK